MANKFYVKEFETMPLVPGGLAQIWGEPGAVQSATCDATHREITLGAKTRFICITSDIDAAYLVSSAGTAAVAGTDFPVWSKQHMAFAVSPGMIISEVAWS